jgi:hypothetical protein
MQRHDLQEWDTTPHVHLDLENWLLTLVKSGGSLSNLCPTPSSLRRRLSFTTATICPARCRVMNDFLPILLCDFANVSEIKKSVRELSYASA